MKIKPLIASFLLLLTSGVLAQMHVENAVIRAMPPGQKVTAAYMVINNPTNEDKVLVSVNSKLGTHIELHESKMEGDVMKMRQVYGLEIPSHGSAVLNAQELHLMIFNLRQDLIEGESHSLNLIYSDGSSQSIEAFVTRIPPTHGKENHDHGTMYKVTPTLKETHSDSQ